MSAAQEREARWRKLVPDLPETAPSQFESFLDEIERWNVKIKLTSPGSRDELALRLVDDSLLLVPHLRGTTLTDVASGAGVPGLPIAIARPGIEVRTVEPIAKKVAFTRAFAALHPTLRIRPFHGRAEGKGDEAWANASTVVSRAFTAPSEWIRIGGPLVAPGGRLIVTLGAGSGVEGDPVARDFGLAPAGSWSGSLGTAPRALRWYDRPA